ncbi:hypothetical protein [Methylobacterium sp. CCH5-D2]|uniref:hypothetical protein n=1 Tax=Methylobacterium sp. CCH5-D2 TaxID=1768765 RepID=UPI000A83E8AF|nr:hypothetical protein [Methylobacterium sp. CCH5-D2]
MGKPANGEVFERLEEVGPGTYRLTQKDEYEGPSEGVTSEIIRFGKQHLPEDIRLRALRLRNKPQYHYNGTLAGPQRDPAWLEIVDDFSGLLEKKFVKLTRILDYAKNHALRDRVGSWINRVD